MEALLFLLNTAVVLALVASSVVNDSRRSGKPLVGLFRYHEDAPEEDMSIKQELPRTGRRDQARSHA